MENLWRACPKTSVIPLPDKVFTHNFPTMPVKGFTKPTETPPRRYSSDPAERARELIAEGRLGGKQPGSGRPRKRVSEAQPRKLAMTTVTERLRESAELIASVIPDVLNDPDATKSERMRAARLAIRIEGIDEDRRREEASEGRRSAMADLDADRAELVAALAVKLAENPLLAQRLGAVLSAAGADTPNPPGSG